jgi:hypothetical protein
MEYSLVIVTNTSYFTGHIGYRIGKSDIINIPLVTFRNGIATVTNHAHVYCTYNEEEISYNVDVIVLLGWMIDMGIKRGLLLLSDESDPLPYLPLFPVMLVEHLNTVLPQSF